MTDRELDQSQANIEVVEGEVPVEPAMVTAGWWRRFFAYFLDGLILSILFALAIAAINFISGHGFGLGNSKSFRELPTPWDVDGKKSSHVFHLNQIWVPVMCLVMFVVYQVTFQLRKSPTRSGQTPGKNATSVRVVRTDGSRVTFRNVLLREGLGKGILYFAVVSVVISVSNNYHYPGIADTFGGCYFLAWWIVFPIFSALAYCPHDLVGGTRVVVDNYIPTDDSPAE